MDSLNKAYAQLRDLFLSLTPAARLTTTLLLGVVVISLVYLVGNFGSGGKDTLIAEFSYSDLVAIEKAFGDAGLREYEIAGSRVKVPHNEKELYLQAMPLDLAMREPDASYIRANASDGAFASSRQIENKQKVARQEKMRRVLLQFNWVEEASVEYSKTRGTGFPRRDEHSALVAVKALGRRHLELSEVKAIRNAIAFTQVGLEIGDVAVLDVNRSYTYLGPSDGMPGESENIYAAHQMLYENMWRKKIEHALQHYPAVVEVTVELNPIMNLVTTKTVFDPKPVVLTSTESTKNTSNKPVDVGGRPGLASNSGNANQAARISASAGQESTTDEQQSATQGVTSQTNTTSKHAPLVPINVAAVIGIPSSYYAQLWPTKWRELNPDGKEVPNPTADDLKRIEQEVKLTVTEAVEGVLKDVDLADDKRKNVKVVTHLVGPPIEFPEVTFSETAIAWLGGHWQTLGMFLLGIFGVVTLRRMVRSGPATASAAADVPATELGVASDESQDDEPETVEARLNQNEFGTGPNLRQELTELVKEDPDAAANILRNWLGDAA